ncbi:MAG: FHA domain-containing protein, partial [Lentisphaeria bacterium]|nr:FHA domain-containing protein [Lentisphaeria bacterium]
MLEHAGTLLYELNTAEYSKEIIIGRSGDCTWTLDGIDSSASARHAVISRRKNNFYITDLGSRNGIYFQNKRIKERKLALGDRVSLGECTLSVEVVEEKNRRVSQFHRLEYMDAKGHRTIIDINKPQMVIGSAPDCDIIFQNQLISSAHAEIQLRSDGSCWIRDLNSRNGTSVNGMELTMDGERMLQDNDVINIAYLEIRFLDAAVEHHDSKVRTSLITLAVTVLVIMAGYIGYMKLTPNSLQIFKMAETEINNGHFEKGRKLLESAARAEGAENTQYAREQLMRKLQLWESVIAMWKSVQRDLEARNYNRATQKLSSMNHDDLNAWTWLPDGALEKKKALVTKKLLDACSSASAVLKNEHATMEDVKSCRDNLVQVIAEASLVKNMNSLGVVIRDAQPLLRRVEKTLSDDNELQATLGLLNNRQPDYQAVLSRLQKISSGASGPVKARADKTLPAILTLNRETQRMLVMIDKVGEMDFTAVNEFRLDLPESIDWSSEKNIGTLRRSLIETVERFKDVSLQLSLIHRTLVSKGIIIREKVPDLAAFLNAGDLKALYDFDCLNMPLPKNSRKEPSGKYDELLGVEFFYEFISNI